MTVAVCLAVGLMIRDLRGERDMTEVRRKVEMGEFAEGV